MTEQEIEDVAKAIYLLRVALRPEKMGRVDNFLSSDPGDFLG
jgi:hypothetical protein